MPTSKEHLIPQARALYAQDLPLDEIAQATGVSLATIYRWKKADAKAGADWDDLRSTRRRKDPRALIAILEDRLMQVAQAEDMEPGAYADTIQKLSNVLHRERERLGDISTILGVLAQFAVYARDHCTDAELALLVRVHEAYLADLKRRLT